MSVEDFGTMMRSRKSEQSRRKRRGTLLWEMHCERGHGVKAARGLWSILSGPGTKLTILMGGPHDREPYQGITCHSNPEMLSW